MDSHSLSAGLGDSDVVIQMVRSVSDIPDSLLNPSKRRFVIGLHYQNKNAINFLLVSLHKTVYFLDANHGTSMVENCKSALESMAITKVAHNSLPLSKILFNDHGIRIRNLMDTHIAYSALPNPEGENDEPECISLTDLFTIHRFNGMTSSARHNAIKLQCQAPELECVWLLPSLHDMLVNILDSKSLWEVAMESSELTSRAHVPSCESNVAESSYKDEAVSAFSGRCTKTVCTYTQVDIRACTEEGRFLLAAAFRYVIRMLIGKRSWKGTFELCHLIFRNGEFLILIPPLFNANVENSFIDLLKLYNLICPYFEYHKSADKFANYIVSLELVFLHYSVKLEESELERFLTELLTYMPFGEPLDNTCLLIQLVVIHNMLSGADKLRFEWAVNSVKFVDDHGKLLDWREIASKQYALMSVYYFNTTNTMNKLTAPFPIENVYCLSFNRHLTQHYIEALFAKSIPPIPLRKDPPVPSQDKAVLNKRIADIVEYHLGLVRRPKGRNAENEALIQVLKNLEDLDHISGHFYGNFTPRAALAIFMAFPPGENTTIDGLRSWYKRHTDPRQPRTVVQAAVQILHDAAEIVDTQIQLMKLQVSTAVDVQPENAIAVQVDSRQQPTRPHPIVLPEFHSPSQLLDASGGSGDYDELPTAQILPQATAVSSTPSTSSGSSVAVGGSVVNAVCLMGFPRDQVTATVRSLTEYGILRSLTEYGVNLEDLNTVLDQLINDDTDAHLP